MGFSLSIRGDERVGNRWVKEKEVSAHMLNRKADKKLAYVAEMFERAMGEKHSATKKELLQRTLYSRGFYCLEFLKLKYSYENRLWAFSYNLDVSTLFENRKENNIKEPCKFIVKNKGKMSIKDAVWIDSGSKCAEEQKEEFLETLNNRLIIERIVALDMVNVVLTFNPNAQEWNLSCRTLIGSATWVLIPPIMQLITPKPIECIKMLEFFELVGSAVSNSRRKG